jgi:hypothetical protein
MGQVRRTVHVPLGGDTERLACPVSQRAVREVPAAWECCRQLSEICDSRLLRPWGWSEVPVSACGLPGMGGERVCSVSVGPRCPPGRKTCHQETLG